MPSIPALRSHRPDAAPRRPAFVSSAVVGVLALALLPACGLLTFDVPVESETTVESGGLVGQLLELGSFAGFKGMDLSSTQAFRNQGVDKQHIDAVRMKTFRLEILDPESGTFGFLDSIEFHVESEGLEPRRVAHLLEIPKDARVLDLALDDVDLAPYVTAESMSLTTKVTGRPPTQDTQIGATVVFEVDVKLF